MEITPIRTEKDHRAALRVVATLIEQDPSLDSPEGERLDVLSSLIEAYEQKHHTIDSPDKGRIGVKNLKDVKAERLANPAVRQAYDAQAPEFELARELIAARTQADLTHGDVAARMGTTQSVVARIESGRGTPSM
jgi:DNA-binding transcriptional regulator YiaG